MGAGTNTGSVARHTSTRKVGLLASLAIVALIAVPASAFAGKGGGGNPVAPWIALDGASGDGLAAAAQPALGDYVTFSSAYPTNVKNPRIEVLCYQGDELVFGMAGGVDYAFLLGGGGSIWLYNNDGVGAECTANLYYFGWRAGTQTYDWLAATHFSAGG